MRITYEGRLLPKSKRSGIGVSLIPTRRATYYKLV
jgi:hypothetical protein